MNNLGKLVPQGGGETIPLLHERITIGRRESCDVCLQFPNISGKHCELTYVKGCWVVQDLGSKNGIKVNEDRVTKKVLQPGDTISIAKHSFVIQYKMVASKETLDELMEEETDMQRSLLEKAGLAPKAPRPGQPHPKLGSQPLIFGDLDDDDDDDDEFDDDDD